MIFRGVARAAAAPPLLRREPVLVRALRPERRAGLALALGGIGERDEGRVLINCNCFRPAWVGFNRARCAGLQVSAATTTRRRAWQERGVEGERLFYACRGLRFAVGYV